MNYDNVAYSISYSVSTSGILHGKNANRGISTGLAALVMYTFCFLAVSAYFPVELAC